VEAIGIYEQLHVCIKNYITEIAHNIRIIIPVCLVQLFWGWGGGGVAGGIVWAVEDTQL
jgi:hypothetical protein